LRYFGYTPNYLRVACEVDAGTELENSISLARLETDCGDYILCQQA